MNAGVVVEAETASRDRIVLANWVALRYFNFYRIVISGLFAVLSLSGKMPPTLSALDARLLAWTSLIYAILAVVAQVLIERRRFSYSVQVYALSAVDIVAIIVLMHAAGGVTSGLGVLLVVAVAGTCLLASGRAGIFVAALASIAFLGETVFGVLYLGYSTANYTQAGVLGAVCFTTAIVAYVLAERARRGEALAARRAVDIENLSLLNEHIVRRMRAGIMVLDRNARVVLMNDAAKEILGGEPPSTPCALAGVSSSLQHLYEKWIETGEVPEATITGRGNINALVSFTELGQAGQGQSGTLVFLEDAAETRQRAQQLKLASLGRLTASIAHEIRNPLGAISHAGQLLSESPDLTEQDGRLIAIVLQHSGRVNSIIENILALGRRKDAVAESFDLIAWFEDFCRELVSRHALDSKAVKVVWLNTDIVVRMDRMQLHQVLWNLCENGLRYAQSDPRLVIEGGINDSNGRPFLDVTDSGPGLDQGFADRLFEPFATTEADGTGLGLYIARELCESNQASLQLMQHSSGCRFRITFAHPDRHQRVGEI